MIRNSVITADLHIHNYKPFSSVDSSGRNTRFVACLNVLSEIFSFAKDTNCKNVFIAGDLFHTRGKIDTIIYDAVYSFIKKESDVHIYLVVGNHDQAVKNGDIHSLRPFRELPHVEVIDIPTTIKNVLFLPYQEKIDFNTFTSAEYLVGHMGVSGATVGASNYEIGEEVSLKHLKKYKLAFLGHFHKGQTLGNVYIPGSPLQHTFGEREDKKGFLHVDHNYNIKWVETHAPKFKLVEVADPADVGGFDKDDYVQFVVQSKKLKFFDFSKVSSNYKVTVDLPKVFEERLEIKPEESDIQILENYIQKFKEPLLNQGLNLEKLKTLGKYIWEKYEKDYASEN
jgi:DNA repair exonuclease SbcCD nuclease subunit